MKFVLFVEGPTEKVVPAFLKRWLDERLNQPVGIQTVRFEGWSELVHDAPKRTHLYLNDPRQKNDIIAVVGLLDLYDVPNPSGAKTVAQRHEWAKSHMEKQVNHPRFRQFFAVHETEAWLLSDPAIFPSKISKALLDNTWQSTIKQPETANFDIPIAHLIDKLYESKTRHAYKKTVDGAELFRKLSPTTVYDKCPYFKAMLDEMLQLAQEAGL